jgi:4-alpha-glucanotransferase
MRVLQFAFDGNEANDHLPHNHTRRCVVYTGTHDNDTIVGWYRGLGRSQERARVRRYLKTQGKALHWDLIDLAYSSRADVAVIPAQDLLGLGSEARMNRPGTMRGNWRWRLPDAALDDSVCSRLSELTRSHGRRLSRPSGG